MDQAAPTTTAPMPSKAALSALSSAQAVTSGVSQTRVEDGRRIITQACGSGACATLIAAARRKLSGRSATVVLDGGELLIEWLPDNHVRMTGGWAESFRGEIDFAELERAVA
jgi:diaminopimelate epimerase